MASQKCRLNTGSTSWTSAGVEPALCPSRQTAIVRPLTEVSPWSGCLGNQIVLCQLSRWIWHLTAGRKPSKTNSPMRPSFEGQSGRAPAWKQRTATETACNTGEETQEPEECTEIYIAFTFNYARRLFPQIILLTYSRLEISGSLAVVI